MKKRGDKINAKCGCSTKQQVQYFLNSPVLDDVIMQREREKGLVKTLLNNIDYCDLISYLSPENPVFSGLEILADNKGYPVFYGGRFFILRGIFNQNMKNPRKTLDISTMFIL